MKKSMRRGRKKGSKNKSKGKSKKNKTGKGSKGDAENTEKKQAKTKGDKPKTGKKPGTSTSKHTSKTSKKFALMNGVGVTKADGEGATRKRRKTSSHPSQGRVNVGTSWMYEVLEGQVYGCANCRCIFNGCGMCRKAGFRGKKAEHFRNLQQQQKQQQQQHVDNMPADQPKKAHQSSQGRRKKENQPSQKCVGPSCHVVVSSQEARMSMRNVYFYGLINYLVGERCSLFVVSKQIACTTCPIFSQKSCFTQGLAHPSRMS